jgi:hypothetical protein
VFNLTCGDDVTLKKMPKKEAVKSESSHAKPSHPPFKEMVKDAIIQLVSFSIFVNHSAPLIFLIFRRKKRDLVVRPLRNMWKHTTRYFETILA